jgi:hypothetical protein
MAHHYIISFLLEGKNCIVCHCGYNCQLSKTKWINHLHHAHPVTFDQTIKEQREMLKQAREAINEQLQYLSDDDDQEVSHFVAHSRSPFFSYRECKEHETMQLSR